MHEEGSSRLLPLAAAVITGHHDVVVWLLSRGADPNGDWVMWSCACNSTAAILQLLIDAGGDVNRESGGDLPLFSAAGSADRVHVVLAQPCLDVSVTFHGQTLEQYARGPGFPMLADMIAQEVSGAD